jgi:hypothetical protein
VVGVVCVREGRAAAAFGEEGAGDADADRRRPDSTLAPQKDIVLSRAHKAPHTDTHARTLRSHTHTHTSFTSEPRAHRAKEREQSKTKDQSVDTLLPPSLVVAPPLFSQPPRARGGGAARVPARLLDARWRTARRASARCAAVRLEDDVVAPRPTAPRASADENARPPSPKPKPTLNTIRSPTFTTRRSATTTMAARTR